jgi:hypothetical protein
MCITVDLIALQQYINDKSNSSSYVCWLMHAHARTLGTVTNLLAQF